MNIEYIATFKTDSGISNDMPVKGKDLFKIVKETMKSAQTACQIGDSYQWKVGTITDLGLEPLLFGMGEKDEKGILHDSGCVNAYNPHMRISKKMLKGISRVERRYGLLDKLFFFDRDENNRHGQGFADGCELEDKFMVGFMRGVRFDGTLLKF
jgi:hypothetical protein